MYMVMYKLGVYCVHCVCTGYDGYKYRYSELGKPRLLKSGRDFEAVLFPS